MSITGERFPVLEHIGGEMIRPIRNSLILVFATLVLAGCSQATTATPPPDTQPEEVTPPNTAPPPWIWFSTWVA